MSKKTTSNNSATALKKRIAELEEENKRLKAKKDTKWLRRFGAGLFAVLAGLMFVSGVLSLWLKSTVLDTETWVENTTKIIQQESVRNDIANKITTELNDNVNIEEYVSDALPEKAKPLAVPISSGIESFINDKTREILASEQFTELWQKVNTESHQAIVNAIESFNTLEQENNSENVLYIVDDKLMLNLRPVLDQVKQDLVNRGLTFLPENQVISSDQVTFEVAQIENLPTVLRAYNALNNLSYWLPIFGFIFAAFAVWIAADRRRALLSVALITILFSVITVQLVKAGEYSVTQNISESAQAVSVESATAIYKIITDDVITSLRWLSGVALIAAAFIFLSGPNNIAVWLRSKVGSLITNYKTNNFVKWLAKYAITVITLLGLLIGGLVVLGVFNSPQPIAWVVAIYGAISLLLLAVKQEVET